MTATYIQKPREIRKTIGQFFTEPRIAEFMASIVTPTSKHITILDPGAGSGILSIKLLQHLEKFGVKSVKLVFYETDTSIICNLKNNISKYRANSTIDIDYKIVCENFILDTINQKFDIIISNPPYFKLKKNSPESLAMQHVVYGQPNIYMLFMAKSIELLKDEGQMIFITPRSFTSGEYFKKFRQFVKEKTLLSHIHIFNDRKKHFKNEQILQELIITKFVKHKGNEKVTITSSSDASFGDIKSIVVKENVIWDAHQRIRIPVNQCDIETLHLFDNATKTLESMGYKISTGKIVVFRNKEHLSFSKCENCVPLLWMHNFKNGEVELDVDFKKERFIVCDEKTKKLLIPTSNYIVIKRFSAKEQKKRINLGFIFKERFPYDYIGLENHLNYVYRQDREMSEEEILTLGKFLNSELVEKYFRILNGNTQVNSKEICQLPIPEQYVEEIHKYAKQQTY